MKTVARFSFPRKCDVPGASGGAVGGPPAARSAAKGWTPRSSAATGPTVPPPGETGAPRPERRRGLGAENPQARTIRPGRALAKLCASRRPQRERSPTNPQGELA